MFADLEKHLKLNVSVIITALMHSNSFRPLIDKVFGICGHYAAIKSSTIKQSMADRLSSTGKQIGFIKATLVKMEDINLFYPVLQLSPPLSP